MRKNKTTDIRHTLALSLVTRFRDLSIFDKSNWANNKFYIYHLNGNSKLFNIIELKNHKLKNGNWKIYIVDKDMQTEKLQLIKDVVDNIDYHNLGYKWDGNCWKTNNLTDIWVALGAFKFH